MKRLFLSLCILATSTACSSSEVHFVRKPLHIDVQADLPVQVNETSGLAVINNRVWTHNDSGGKNEIYQLSSDYKTVTKTVSIKGNKNYDWEDLTQDERYLYVGDTGNNSTRRNGGVIYKLRISDVEKYHSVMPYNVIRYQFKNFHKAKTYQHNFDSEAIASVGDKIWLFSKNWNDEQSQLYVLSKSAQRQLLKPVATYPTAGLITGADYNPQIQTMALVGYRKDMLLGYAFIWLVKVKNDRLDWSTAVYKRLGVYGQWEGIHWDGADKLLLTTEKNPLTKALIGTVDVSFYTK